MTAFALLEDGVQVVVEKVLLPALSLSKCVGELLRQASGRRNLAEGVWM